MAPSNSACAAPTLGHSLTKGVPNTALDCIRGTVLDRFKNVKRCRKAEQPLFVVQNYD